MCAGGDRTLMGQFAVQNNREIKKEKLTNSKILKPEFAEILLKYVTCIIWRD